MSSTMRAAAPNVSPAQAQAQAQALTTVLQRGTSTLVSPASSHASRLAALRRIATVLTAAPRHVWGPTQDVPCSNVTWTLVSHLRLLHAQAAAATSALLGVRSGVNNQDTKTFPDRVVAALSEALHEAEQCLLLLPGLILSHSAASDLLGSPGAVDLLLALLGLFAGLRHPYALPNLYLPRIPDSSTIIPKSSLRVLATNLVVLSLRTLGPALIGQSDLFGARGGEDMVDQIRPMSPGVGSVPSDGDRKVSGALDECLTLVYHPDQAVHYLALSTPDSFHSHPTTFQASQTTQASSRPPTRSTPSPRVNVPPAVTKAGSISNEEPTTSARAFVTPSATPARSQSRKASLAQRREKAPQPLDSPHASILSRRDDRALSTPTLKSARPKLDERFRAGQHPVSTPVTPVSGGRLNALWREAGNARSRNLSLTSTTSSQESSTLRTPLRHAQSRSTSSSSGVSGSPSPALKSMGEGRPTRSQSAIAVAQERLPSTSVPPRATSSSPQPHTHSKLGPHRRPAKSSSTLVPLS